MAYTTIDKPTDYFNTKLYTGNGSTQSITGVGFQPDWLWIKSRGSTGNGRVHDVVRGVDKQLYTSLTNAEFTYSPNTGVTSFDSDGFSLGSDIGQNTNTETYVAWNWLAGGSASSNSNGSITSSVSANTTAGFSIVSYTGTGSVETIGHGLGTTPAMIILKNRTISGDYWHVYHQTLGGTKALYLQTTDAAATTSASWNNTNPTSTVFTNGSSTYTNSSEYIVYCFAEKKGYSKFGNYTGNGNNDGTFIYTGFKPAWVMIKRSNSSGEGWHIYDNKRNTFNLVTQILTAHNSNQEATGSAGGDVIDMLSQGFKCRGTHGAINGSSNTYIYMAFAESPFVTSTGIPTVGRWYEIFIDPIYV